MSFSKIDWPEDFNFGARALFEQFISVMCDFAYGYDLEDEAFEVCKQFLEENDIEYEVDNDDVE